MIALALLGHETFLVTIALVILIFVGYVLYIGWAGKDDSAS